MKKLEEMERGELIAEYLTRYFGTNRGRRPKYEAVVEERPRIAELATHRIEEREDSIL